MMRSHSHAEQRLQIAFRAADVNEIIVGRIRRQNEVAYIAVHNVLTAGYSREIDKLPKPFSQAMMIPAQQNTSRKRFATAVFDLHVAISLSRLA